jgi:hypothetical protein
MDKPNLKLIKEYIQSIINEYITENNTAFITTAKGREAVSFKDTKELEAIKNNSDVRGIKTASGQKLKEMAAPATVTYALKADYEDILPKLLDKIKKEPVKKIISKIVDIIKEKDITINPLFDELKKSFANEPDVLIYLKNPQNVKGWLWGGLNSEEFKKRYLKQINPVTNEPWEPGNLNAVPWTPFVRSKDKRLTDYMKAQQLKDTNPEEFQKKQDLATANNTLAEKVILYKALRTNYLSSSYKQKVDFKIDKTSKEKSYSLEDKMDSMLNDNLASALLYQWSKGFIGILDKPLLQYANSNGLLNGKKQDGLTSKYRSVLQSLVKTGDIKLDNTKEFDIYKNRKSFKNDELEDFENTEDFT